MYRTQLAAGSLLTSRHIVDWTHSATARHEHAAKRNANGHRAAKVQGLRIKTDGSLLTEGLLCEQTHSATARHEHAAKRNANEAPRNRHT